MAVRGYQAQQETTLDPLTILDWYQGPPVPDPITFIIGDTWLNRGKILYPRQATLIKIIFLRDDLFTDYDHEVIAEWIQEFYDTNPEGQAGEKFSDHTNGIQPDIYERIAYLKERGYKWFKEVILALGRRAGKGYVCALAMAYVLWNYMSTANPQDYYGIDEGKQLALAIFAGKRDQAKENLWGDLYAVITQAPCFTPYISEALSEILTVYAPYDFVRMQKMAQRGIASTKDVASFRIVPRESVPLAARGPAGFCLGFDEAAHVTSTGVTRAFGDVYKSATPSLRQFGPDGFICLPSSTWEMVGKFYELWNLSLQQEPDPEDPSRRIPIYFDKLMLQVSSWAMYQDWERAHLIPLFPQGFTGDLGEYDPEELPILSQLRGAILAYDEEMQREERANPDAFAVEYLSHWQTALDSYLRAGKVDQMFAPWEGRLPGNGIPQLTMQTRGPLSISYRAHGDPSDVNCRFGFAMAHTEYGTDGMQHAVFDIINFWDPADFPGHTIDYDKVMDWIFYNAVLPFQPEEVTFDQYNTPATVQRLQKEVRAASLQKNVVVYERTATAPLNWSTYETFKASLYMNFVHAPFHEEARDELKFIKKPEGVQKVVAPDSGPVTTKDIADCISIVTASLLGEQMRAFLARDLRNQRPAMALQGGYDPLSRFDPGRNEGNPYASQLSMPGRGALARGMRPGMPPPPSGPDVPGRMPAHMRRHRS